MDSNAKYATVVSPTIKVISGKVIVWGGIDINNTSMTSGSIYDPSTNTWTAMSITNAPAITYTVYMSPQAGITNDNKLILWSTSQRIGGVFDPSTNSWITISTTNSPSTRYNSVSAWTGSQFIIWGGCTTDSGYGSCSGGNLTDGAMYDPTTDTWTAMSNTNAPVAGASVCNTWTGSKLFIWGGTNFSAGQTSGALFDPSTNSWMTLPTSTLSTSHLSSPTYMIGSKVLVTQSVGSSPSELSFYDPATNTWSKIDAHYGVPPRSGHTMVQQGAGFIVWGGEYGLRLY